MAIKTSPIPGVHLACSAHPYYQAKRVPSSGCATCLDIWYFVERIREISSLYSELKNGHAYTQEA